LAAGKASMKQDGDCEHEIERLPTLVPGLDDILCGGFLRGGLYMFLGPPGSGKTILASQITYAHAAQGRKVLFVTVLGENHGRMMAHLRSMRFFDQSLIPDPITYISGYHALEEEGGLRGVTTLLSREVQNSGAALLVLDGMTAIEAKAATDIFGMKRFTHDLQTLASATDCTIFLLTSSSGARSAPEYTMVDGMIELQQRLFASRAERRLIVHKFRGSDHLDGEHAYRISGEGLVVFPRIEARFAKPVQQQRLARTRTSSGIASLDELLHGGLPAGAMTALIGPPGAGKTTMALQFLAQSSDSEPGLLFGCHESPESLRFKASNIGIDMAGAEQRCDIEVLWYPVGERILDELAYQLLESVRRRGVKRLVIDGVAGFEQASLEQQRMTRFWSALSHELRRQGVTTLHTMDAPDLIGPRVHPRLDGLSMLAEVLILLKYVEIHSKLTRLIALYKVLEGSFDPSIREFALTDAGMVIGQPFARLEAILSGMARNVPNGAAAILPESDAMEAGNDEPD
jgi:circadian clock protein KaiC